MKNRRLKIFSRKKEVPHYLLGVKYGIGLIWNPQYQSLKNTEIHIIEALGNDFWMRIDDRKS